MRLGIIKAGLLAAVSVTLLASVPARAQEDDDMHGDMHRHMRHEMMRHEMRHDMMRHEMRRHMMHEEMRRHMMHHRMMEEQ